MLLVSYFIIILNTIVSKHKFGVDVEPMLRLFEQSGNSAPNMFSICHRARISPITQNRFPIYSPLNTRCNVCIFKRKLTEKHTGLDLF